MAVNILIGAESFAELRRKQYWYVDKTGFLEKFLSPVSAKVTLFTRPRRFGKTLTLSMMSEFLDITKQSGGLFSGLRISGNRALCDQWMNQYPVVFMSLKDIDGVNFSKALASFREIVMDVCAKYEQLRESANVLDVDRNRLIAIKENRSNESVLQRFLATLTRALEAYYGRPAIVLIDEYDVPVANAWKNGYYDEMIQFMRGFLGAALKGNFSLEFAVLTGCLRITKESIFTGLNNLECRGIDDDDDDYTGMFGFTGEEVDALLAEAGLSDRKDVVREWYDGYCFGKHRDIYCPWSILNHVKTAQKNVDALPRAWWVHTSANELTMDFINRLSSGSVPGDRNGHGGCSAMEAHDMVEEVRDRMTRLWTGESIAVSLNETPGYVTIFDDVDNFWTLLYMTGYLTKARDTAKCVDIPGIGQTVLTIPNKEVREAFRLEIGSWFKRQLPHKDRREFFNAFWRADAEQCGKLLSTFLLGSVSWHDTRDRSEPENSWHCILLGIFAMTGCCVRSNREEGEGRYDLSVTEPTLSRGAILEIKRADTAGKLDSAADAGLNQIAEKRYDSRLRLEGYRTILHWSMAFCGKRCQARARVVALRA